jgi:hypothetical protein
MASRAHVIHDLFADARPRRYVRYRSDDPVELPLSRSWGMGGAVAILALITAGVAAAGAYSVFHAAPTPALAETPLLPLERDLGSDAELTHAHIIKALNGPALAVRSIEAPETAGAGETFAPTSSAPRDDYVIDDAAPGVQPQLPKPAPVEAPYPEHASPPYPNPSTTPPEGIAPPDASPETPTPALDPENPYR